MLTIIKALLATALAFSYLASYAMSPEEYCQIHMDSNAPGICTVRGNCAVLTTNLGTEECKICTDGGCELVNNCNECPPEEPED